MDNNINFDDIDIDFDAHLQRDRQVLLKYKKAIQSLRLLAEQKYHVRPNHFDNYLLLKYFQSSNGDEKDSQNGNKTELPPEPLLTSLLNIQTSLLKIELLKHIRNRRRQIIYWFSYFLVASILFFVYFQNLNEDRNLVYPSMRLWRRLTLPLIQRYPRLTEFYDESCLMGNPFFQIDDLNCEPCANIDSVVDYLEDYDESRAESGSASSSTAGTKYVPFMFKINQSNIQIEDFFGIYNKNQEIFRRDAFRVQSTNRYINNLEDLFYQFNSSNDDTTVHGHSKMQTHSLWRCNRMLPARLLRPIIASSSSSSHLPTTGIALERYVSFDTSRGPTYSLPDTECANVYVQQLRGTRFIILRPTSECHRHRCHTLSVRLQQSFVLSYNWWYWKPISAPDPVAETSSISLIGSYC